MYTFLKSLATNVIDEPDLDKAIAKTRSLLEKADAVWDIAIATNLKDKMVTINGETVIRPELISEARVSELVNGEPVSRPIIDLVQQGGGMYGIALAGYSYIMEKAGIRFYSLGGTSAGGINAMLLGTLPNSIYGASSPICPDKQASKSELLAHIISNTHFHKFMDRGGIAGWLQRMLMQKMSAYAIKAMLIAFMLLMPIGIYMGFGLLINDDTAISLPWTRTYDYLIGTLVAVSPLLLAYILLIRILGKNFGINSGDLFYDWVKAILSDPFVNITTTAQLEQRLLSMRFTTTTSAPQGEKESAKLVLIASNLTYNRIVKFPERACDYWMPVQDVNPAAYVRATMSIPFVFATFIPDYGHVENNGTPAITKSRFVDGGMLSNFPIREFHNNSITKPRFPTFGVLLNESPVDLDVLPQAQQQREDFADVTLLSYIVSFLSTFRNFYDNDFLRSSEEIKLRVVEVETKGFHWLDFWMSDAAKQQLFQKGAEAAIRQLYKFEFDKYLKLR